MPLFSEGHALLVGVGGPNFSETAADAKALHDLLIDAARAGYDPVNVALLSEATANKASILAAFRDLGGRLDASPGGTAIVYFSGHGQPYRDEVGVEKYFLVPTGFDALDPAGTAISGKEFTEALEKLNAKKLLVLLDCCHAAGVAKSTPTVPPEVLEMLQRGTGRVVVASSTAGEKSWVLKDEPNSVFTQSLLEVLNRSASQDGFARIIDVIRHLLEDVPRRTKDLQHAFVNKIVGLSENFAVCAVPLAPGTTKAPPGPSVHAVLTGPILARELSLKNALRRLDYSEQVKSFYGLVEKKLGLALIHGPSEHGQRWLMGRLHLTVDGGFEPLRHDCRQRSQKGGPDNIWRRLGSMAKQPRTADRATVAKAVRDLAAKRPVMLAFENVEHIDLPLLLEEVWKPLHDVQPAPTDGFPFVMLLLTEDDKVSTHGAWADKCDPPWTHAAPLRLPMLKSFDADLLDGWLNNCIDDLPASVRRTNLADLAKKLVADGGGAPAEILELVCELWGLNWFDLEKKWIPL